MGIDIKGFTADPDITPEALAIMRIGVLQRQLTGVTCILTHNSLMQ